MLQNFKKVEEFILKKELKKRIVLCGAHDEGTLEAIVHAKRKGVVNGILIGDETQICSLLKKMGEDSKDYEIIDAPGERDSSEMAVSFVREGRADIEMKGLMPSTEFLLPIMNPFNGLMAEDTIMSETTVYYYPDQDRMMFATDCALNITPKLEEKVKLIKNAVSLAKAFGFKEKIKVAALSALEKVNPQIPSSGEAAELAKMDWDEDIIIAGPFALDNALDEVTARHKGIESEVAGCADILLMPDLCAGNVFHKCIHYFGHMESAAVVCGTTKPIVFTSRSDSAETKYNSILAAILQSIAIEKEN